MRVFLLIGFLVLTVFTHAQRMDTVQSKQNAYKTNPTYIKAQNVKVTGMILVIGGGVLFIGSAIHTIANILEEKDKTAETLAMVGGTAIAIGVPLWIFGGARMKEVKAELAVGTIGLYNGAFYTNTQPGCFIAAQALEGVMVLLLFISYPILDKALFRSSP